MINTITIYNQNISVESTKLKVRFDQREVVVELPGKSVLAVRPHLFCAWAGGKIHFDENEIEVQDRRDEKIRPETGDGKTIGDDDSETPSDDNNPTIRTPPRVVSVEMYKKELLLFLHRYIETKEYSSRSKMDLVRLYFSVNDLERASAVLSQMKRSPNVRMLQFILKTCKAHTREDEDADFVNLLGWQESRYRRFVKICRELDGHTAYIFGLETLHVFNSRHLIHMSADLEKIFYTSGDVLSVEHAVSKDVLYGLSMLLMSRVAAEFVSRGHLRMAAGMLVKMAARPAVDDRHLAEELLSLAFGLLETPWILFEEMLDCENWLFLTAAQKFSIRSRFRMEDETEHSGDWRRIYTAASRQHHRRRYRVEVSSGTSIFKFGIDRHPIQGVFTDTIKVTVKTQENKEMRIMGVVDREGTFYAADRNRIAATGDFHGDLIILQDGEQVEHAFEMLQLKRGSSIELIEIETREEAGRSKEVIRAFMRGGKSQTSRDIINSDIINRDITNRDIISAHVNRTAILNSLPDCKAVKFGFKGGGKIALQGSLVQVKEGSFIHALFPGESKVIEACVEVGEGVYECLEYHV